MIVSPEDYAEIGVPICSECGNDLEYVRTEIYQTKESITPIKRKKSYPDWSSMFDVGNKVEVLADKTDIFNDFVGTVYGFKSRGIVGKVN
jgi:hypothetical protein